MAKGTGIEWTEETWNPVVGCSKVSLGCANCYAEELHERLMDGKHGYPTFKPWNELNADHNVTLLPERLDKPLRWTRPRMIFVNSMSDLFHENVPDDYIAQVFAVMVRAKHHTFQVLTKRPERMASLLNDVEFWLGVADYITPHDPTLARQVGVAAADGGEVWALNVWLGTSIENRRFVDRADLLRDTPAAVRFISAEPLLGPLLPDGPLLIEGVEITGPPEPDGEGHMSIPFRATDARKLWEDRYEGPGLDLTGIDWLIVGGESGPKHRPMDIQWVRDLRDACHDGGRRRECAECEGTGWERDDPDQAEGPPCQACTHGGYYFDPETAFFYKQQGGRTPKSNGRELDGREWSEMPGEGTFQRANNERTAST